MFRFPCGLILGTVLWAMTITGDPTLTATKPYEPEGSDAQFDDFKLPSDTPKHLEYVDL